MLGSTCKILSAIKAKFDEFKALNPRPARARWLVCYMPLARLWNLVAVPQKLANTSIQSILRAA